jgi:hypothetical protein
MKVKPPGHYWFTLVMLHRQMRLVMKQIRICKSEVGAMNTECGNKKGAELSLSDKGTGVRLTTISEPTPVLT